VLHLFICLAYQDEACPDAQLWDCSEQRHRDAFENMLHEEYETDREIGILKLQSV
jgi:hypothetical protein